ncbi:MAG: hypothetical protein FWH54_00195 [Methanobrevibacter sp.]|nr:hypothetical protein [Methanobrevibacter sp.]
MMRKVLRKKMDLLEIAKITVSGNYEKVTIPKKIAKRLKIKEYYEKGEPSYITFKIRDGELSVAVTNEHGKEIYGMEDENNGE